MSRDMSLEIKREWVYGLGLSLLSVYMEMTFAAFVLLFFVNIVSNS